MADNESIYTEPSASAADRNLLQLCNEVSQFILGEDAQSQIPPTKNAIIAQINRTQRNIVNKHHNWKFLQKTATVNGYVSTGVTGTLGNAAALTGLTDWVTGTNAEPNTVTYFAQTHTPQVNIELPSSAVMGFEDYGYGIIEYTGYAYICPDLNGSPDLDHYLLKSDQLTITAGTSGGSANTFMFSTTAPIVKGVTYWVVYELTAGANNNVSIYPAILTPNTSTGGKRKLGTGAWENITTGNLYSSVSFTTANYVTQLTLPSDVQTVYEIRSGNSPILTEFASDVYDGTYTDLPTDTFVVIGFTAGTNYYIVDINPSANALTWTVKYRCRATQLSDDLHTSIIPGAYQDMLIWDALIAFRAHNIQMTDIDFKKFALDYDNAMATLELDYRPRIRGLRPHTGRTGRGGSLTLGGASDDRRNMVHPTKPINGFRTRRG